MLRVRSLLGLDQNVDVRHIPKEKNNASNFLAREASRLGQSRPVWLSPLSSVMTLLYIDVLG